MRPAAAIFDDELHRVRAEADRALALILCLEYGLCALLALFATHELRVLGHVVHPLAFALVAGALLNAAPLALLARKPGGRATRHAMAAAQMLWVLLFQHVSDSSMTHSHVFLSLALLSIYRDPRLFITAGLMVGADPVVRTLSGVPLEDVGWAHWMEHATWAALTAAVLVYIASKSLDEMRLLARRTTEAESQQAKVEALVEERARELRESHAQYRALVETANAMPWEVDADTKRVVYVGPQSRRILGIPPEQVTTQRLIEVVHPDDRERILRVFKDFAALDGGEVEYRIMLGGVGPVVYARTTISVAPSPDGKRGILRGLTFDITEKKKLEIELAHAQKLESVGRLAAGIAHEINTPIQYVSDNVHFLCEATEQLAAAVDEVASTSEGDLAFVRANLPAAREAALEGLQRVAFIVQSMKRLAYQDGGEVADADLDQAVLATVTVARSEYKYIADVVTDLGGLPPVPCRISDINQVVLNIVVNAAHAIEEKLAQAPGERGVITVRTWIEGEHACIAVRDTGTGIAPAVRDRIYDPFFTTKPVGKGSGQGLPLARAIVEQHGGRLELESEAGVGTTFTVRLPLVAPVTSTGERRAA